MSYRPCPTPPPRFYPQGTKVLLNVYDLSPANDFLYSAGLGLHHSGVEVSGSEYSFASGAGVFESTPREAPGAKYRGTVELGTCEGGSADLKRVLDGECQRSVRPGGWSESGRLV